MSDESENMLVDSKIYLKSGIHIGTKFKTKHMDSFIYKTRPDGLTVLNLQKIDERLNLMCNLLSKYDPKDILVVSRRENGWKPIKIMGEITGIRFYAGRYPPGILTNTNLKNFTETKIILVTDPWPDRNVVDDALKVGIPVIALCDTNNQINNIDLVVPCNNKGKKSLGVIFYILTKEYLLRRGVIKKQSEFKYTEDDFTEE